jgi:hypothetical protein
MTNDVHKTSNLYFALILGDEIEYTIDETSEEEDDIKGKYI